MALEVDIIGNNTLAPTAEKLADTLQRIAAGEEKIAKFAEKLGVSHQQAAKAVSVYEKEAKDALAVEMKREQKRLASESKIKADRLKANEDFKKQLAYGKEIDKVFTSVALGATAAAAAIGVAGVALGMAAKSTDDAKRQSQALIGSWTGGAGADGIKKLDRYAETLGLRFQDVRDKFVEFRQAGLDNKMSLRLIGLRADLIAAGLSAEEADKQIAPVLQEKGGRRQLLVIEDLARAFHVAGTGADAAAKKAESLDAALNKLDNTKTVALQQVWDAIGPAIGKAGNHLANFVVDLYKSKDGQEYINGLTNAFLWAAGAVDNMLTSLEEGKKKFDASPELQKIGRDYNSFVNEVTGFNAVRDWGARMVAEVKLVALDMYDAAKDVVSGFARGLADRATSAVAGAKTMAEDIARGFADKLGIHSPSKVFEGFGKNTVEGYERGEAMALPDAMPLQAAAAKPPVASSAPSRGGAGVSVVIEQLLVQVAEGDAADIAMRIREELQRVLTAGDLSRGVIA